MQRDGILVRQPVIIMASASRASERPGGPDSSTVGTTHTGSKSICRIETAQEQSGTVQTAPGGHPAHVYSPERGLRPVYSVIEETYFPKPPQPTVSAMTPTPTVLLLVALFWTLPATTAVVMYRTHGNSLANVTAAVRRRFDRVTEALQFPQTQTEA